jgi:YD repeat-containing protein
MNSKAYRKVKKQLRKLHGKVFPVNTINRNPSNDIHSNRRFSLLYKLVCITLLANLFSMPVLAATPDLPQTVSASFSEITQDIRFAFSSGILSSNLLPSRLLALILEPVSAKKRQENAPTTIVILPGDDPKLLQGERLNFTAIGLDNDNQPVNGLQFNWTIQDTSRSRQPQPLPNGNFTGAIHGTFIVTAETLGRQAQVTVTVHPNEGFRLHQMLQKDERSKTEKEKKQIKELREKGLLTSRDISSKKVYSAEEEKKLNLIDQRKRNEAKIRQAEKLKRNSAQNQDSNFDLKDKTIRRGGPSAEGIDEYEVKETEAETAIKPAAPQPVMMRPIDEDGWSPDDWWTADDPVNQVGTPPNAAPAAGAGNGNFQIAAPVVSLPGRGIDLNLALVYNSRLWSKSGSYIKYDSDKGFPGPGWSLGFGKMMYLGGNGGCMIVGADGTRQSYEGTPNVYSYGSYYSSSYVGHTTDGSFVDYNCSYSSSTYGTSLSGYATFPNGTTITYSSPTGVYDQVYPTQITDAQGNYITISYVNNQGPNIQTITDTTGRVVNFNYDAGNRLISVTGPGVGSTTRTFIRLHYSQLNLNYAFAPGIYPDTPTNSPYVLDAIYYPVTNTGFWFGDTDSYSSYGMIAKVLEQRAMTWSGGLNDQGTITPGVLNNQRVYNFTPGPDSSLTDAPDYTKLTESWAGMDTAAVETNYSVTSTPTEDIVTVTAPNGTKNRQTTIKNPGVWNDGMYFQNETLSPSDAPLGKMKVFLAQGSYGSSRPTRAETTDPKGQTTATELDYGANYNQVIEQREFNYAGQLYRKTNTIYENSPAYLNRHIFSLVKSTELYDAAGARLAKTDYQYDYNAVAGGAGTLVATPGVTMHKNSYDPYTTETVETPGFCATWTYDYPECSDEVTYAYVGEYPQYMVYCPSARYCSEYSEPTSESVYDPATVYRGNVTKITTYADAANVSGAIEYDSVYDVTGNARTTITNCCQQMSFNYTVNTQYSQPDQHTKGSSDPNSALRITEGATYDFNTGVSLTTTDFNGLTTTASYDAIARLVQINLPTGGYKLMEYFDPTHTTRETLKLADNTIARQSTTYLNGRGQAKSVTMLSANGQQNASTVKYDVMGRKSEESMPYDAATAPTLWTVYTYDALSRVTQIQTPDGSLSKTFYNEASRPDSATNALGQTIRSQDTWGRERWVRTDDFGRLTEIVEPYPLGSGSVFEAGSLQTNYA